MCFCANLTMTTQAQPTIHNQLVVLDFSIYYNFNKIYGKYFLSMKTININGHYLRKQSPQTLALLLKASPLPKC